MSKILRAVATAAAAVAGFGGVALMTFEHESVGDAAVLGVSMGRNDGEPNGLAKKQVVASGAVEGLHPGAVRPLVVRLRNENNFPVAVTDLVVSVRSQTAGCDSGVIQVEEFHGSHLVARNGSGSLTVAARMHNDAPDACKRASFALTYSGVVVKP